MNAIKMQEIYTEWFAAIYLHLHPGAFLMAFGGCRTYHRLACAIEDAGFIIHPAIGWLFGAGFPKATNLHVQFERTLCEKRADKKWYYLDDGQLIATKPPFRHPEANVWYSHRYGLQALKPAFEFICIAQKPYQGRPADCITETGAGALNVDGGRVGTGKDVPASPRRAAQGPTYGDLSNDPATGSGWDSNTGRWPPNLALCHLPGCRAVGEERVRSGNSVHPSDMRGCTWQRCQIEAGPHYASPDGLETVTRWECEEPFTATLFSYAYRNHVLSAVDGPLYLQDRLPTLIQDLRGCSTNGIALSLDACEVYRSGHIQSADSPDARPYAIACALRLAELPDFRAGCPADCHFCDVHIRQILAACREGPRQLAGVLAAVYLALSARADSRSDQLTVPPSSADDLPPCDDGTNTPESKTAASNPCPNGDETPSRIPGTLDPDSCVCVPNSSPENKTGVPCVPEQTYCRNAGILLSLLAFDTSWRYFLPASIIQRNGIVVKSNGCPIAALNQQAGEKASGGRQNAGQCVGLRGNVFDHACHNPIVPDSGPVARFFPQCGWEYEVAEQIAGVFPAYYCAKASRGEREAGCEGMPQVDNATEINQTRPICNICGCGTIVPGPGKTMACGHTDIRFEPSVNDKHGNLRKCSNHHPTVKPIALARWLATLLLPPAEYAPRRLLVPFAGTGSEAIGALLAGWEEVVAVEMEAEYCAIAEARLAWWNRQPRLL